MNVETNVFTLSRILYAGKTGPHKHVASALRAVCYRITSDTTKNNKLLSSHQQKHTDKKHHAHSANNVCEGSETCPISNNNQYVVTRFSIHQQLTLLLLYRLLLDVAEDQILQDYKVSQETQ